MLEQIGEEWDDSLQSKEQIEANLLNKYEAAMRRERAMAYSFSHQVPYPPFCSTFILLQFTILSYLLLLDLRVYLPTHAEA